MKSLRLRFPWKKIEKGQGFFIPCLDPEAVKVEGLKAAVRYRVFDARAKIGIKNGLLGVQFFRIPRA
jgi:hypothetical protein